MKKLAILTGHSRGLGAALVQDLLGRGCSVIGLSRQPLSDSVAPFVQPGVTFDQIAVDLSDLDRLERLLADDCLGQSVREADQVVLINNAGLLSPVGLVGEQSPTQIAQTVAVNVGAVLMLTNWFVQASQGCADRRVVQISSGAARSPYVGWSVYCATKAALDHHARCLAMESEHPGGPASGLRICSLAPGVIDTDMQAQVRASELSAFPMRPKFDELKATGGLAKPSDVSQKLCRVLFSDAFGRDPVADLRSIG
jgi:benzil reductase ((S)-benzoin forming)